MGRHMTHHHTALSVDRPDQAIRRPHRRRRPRPSSCHAGVVAGFVGPNGAGKTTTMAMLLGLVRPTAGTGTVLGRPIEHAGRLPAARRCADREPGVLPGPHRRRRTCGCSPPSAATTRRRSPACSSTSGCDDRGDDRYRSYSLGMKQRLGIAAALLGDPELLDPRRAGQRPRPAGRARDARPHRALAGTVAPCSCRRTTSASSSRCATGSC